MCFYESTNKNPACRIISELVEKALEEESNTCNVSGVQSVFMSILQAHGLDVKDKKAAIIDFIAAGIQTVSLKIIKINPKPMSQIFSWETL